MSLFPLKPTHAPVKAYYEALAQFHLHGLWEAKDTSDDLDHEIRIKVAKGYSLSNTLFQSRDRVVLYQENRIAFDGTSLR